MIAVASSGIGNLPSDRPAVQAKLTNQVSIPSVRRQARLFVHHRVSRCLSVHTKNPFAKGNLRLKVLLSGK